MTYMQQPMERGRDRKRLLTILALLFALIPAFGLYGALAAKLAATTIQLAIKYFHLRRSFGAIVVQARATFNVMKRPGRFERRGR
mgnify:CR=1 FL=1